LKEHARKKAVVGGKTDIEKPMEFNVVKEWDEPKEQVIEAMKLNANQLTNLIKSLLTPDKERQLEEIIKNKEDLDKIKPFWGDFFLTWESMQKLRNFDINDEDITKNGLVQGGQYLLQGISCTAG
jgi:hypothetical protein